MVPTWGRGGRAVGGDGRVWAARGARSPAPPVHGAGGASVGSCEVRRWVRHSVRCWSHATEGSQTRHVAGSRSQQRLLRASASLTPTRRGAPAGGQGSVALGAPGCTPHGAGTRARGQRPSAEHPGDHVRAEGAAGDGHRAARGPRWACSSARASATRPEMPQVSGEGSEMSQRISKASALRASRGLPGCRGDCHGSRRCPVPVRRARRARSRAWACRGGAPPQSRKWFAGVARFAHHFATQSPWPVWQIFFFLPRKKKILGLLSTPFL